MQYWSLCWLSVFIIFHARLLRIKVLCLPSEFSTAHNCYLLHCPWPFLDHFSSGHMLVLPPFLLCCLLFLMFLLMSLLLLDEWQKLLSFTHLSAQQLCCSCSGLHRCRLLLHSIMPLSVAVLYYKPPEGLGEAFACLIAHLCTACLLTCLGLGGGAYSAE